MTTKHKKLTLRPQPINGIQLPTIRNIDESEYINPVFQAVITAGPEPTEVQWNHPNHRIWTFDDTTDNYYGPKLNQVEEMIFWGAEQEDLLVHCHAGISRSTATAWGVSIAKGLDPLESFEALYDAHPDEFTRRRPFSPNPLIVKHLQDIFNDNTLLDIRRSVLKRDPQLSLWI